MGNMLKLNKMKQKTIENLKQEIVEIKEFLGMNIERKQPTTGKLILNLVKKLKIKGGPKDLSQKLNSYLYS
mgnify:CR=1 FL=1